MECTCFYGLNQSRAPRTNSKYRYTARLLTTGGTIRTRVRRFVSIVLPISSIVINVLFIRNEAQRLVRMYASRRIQISLGPKDRIGLL
jgi:hypothetical protein